MSESSSESSSESRKKQRDQALEWLSRYWPQPRECPICGTNDWNIGDIVIAPIIGQQLSGWVSTYFPVTCKTCGYTLLFDAIVMGVLEGDIEPLP